MGPELPCPYYKNAAMYPQYNNSLLFYFVAKTFKTTYNNAVTDSIRYVCLGNLSQQKYMPVKKNNFKILPWKELF